MSIKLKPYSEYKGSGVPWLGQVPEHWEIRRQRNVMRMLVSNIDKHTLEGELPVRATTMLMSTKTIELQNASRSCVHQLRK